MAQILTDRPKFVCAKSPTRFVSARSPAKFVAARARRNLFVSRVSAAVGTSASSGGYSKRSWDHDGTFAIFSKNRLVAPNLNMLTPVTPTDFDDFLVVVTDPANSGCVIEANTADDPTVTIDGGSSFPLDIVPCAVWFSYDASAHNWVKIGVTT